MTEMLLAEALPEGILIVDDRGHVSWWNQVAKNLLQLTPELQNAHIDEVLQRALYKKLQREPQLSFKPLQNPNLFLQLKLRPYADGQTILIVQDMTLTKRLETMRQDFIANVSHELRTPLTVFHGYLELLKDGMDLSAEQLAEMVTHMTGQADRMLQLVEDLLLLSRLESVEPNPDSRQAVPVASIIHNIVEDAKSLSGARNHKFNLTIDEGLTLASEPEELRSAFSNLIYNAVHYTPAGGLITVRWYQDATGKHMEVEDSGIGIAKKHIPRLTQRFYRVDKARSSKAGGTGLGLAIVKHVLLRHQGDLEVESEVGKGSLFRCSFQEVELTESRLVC